MGQARYTPGMSWEAYRWTAKSPSELYHVLGPHGVDELIRQALGACWRDSPAEGRSLATVAKLAREVFDRNMKVWAAIKTPSPASFFQDLRPNPADQFFRQAMVTCWMMMPRVGGRQVGEVRRIIGNIFERNMAAWAADDATFTGAPKKKAKPGSAKMKGKQTAKKKVPAAKKGVAASRKIRKSR